MVDKFRAGDAQEWNSHGSMGRGKVKKKLTTRTLIKGHAVAGSLASEGHAASQERSAGDESLRADERVDNRDS